jgi:hypothetical protein
VVRVCSRHGASSGLHHDYHDNLYVLLKGRKRFQLFAPGEAPRMYAHICLYRSTWSCAPATNW